jgi:hypothetical protein
MDTVAGTLEAAVELAREHDEIDRLATLISTLGTGAARRAVVLELCNRYAVHAQVEARYLMPAVRRHLPEGARIAADETARHEAVVRTIAAFLRLCDEREPEPEFAPKPAPGSRPKPAPESGPDPGEPAAPGGFDEADELDIVIGQLVAGIQCHVEQQDAVLLPRLHLVCPLAESRRLGRQLRQALDAARRAEQPGVRARERRHWMRALLHHVFRGLFIRAGQPADAG